MHYCSACAHRKRLYITLILNARLCSVGKAKRVLELTYERITCTQWKSRIFSQTPTLIWYFGKNMIMRIIFYLFFSSYYYYKGQIQSVSSVLSVPSCWSLTIIIVWENHKQWQQIDCLGLAKLSSKHWINYVIIRSQNILNLACENIHFS